MVMRKTRAKKMFVLGANKRVLGVHQEFDGHG